MRRLLLFLLSLLALTFGALWLNDCLNRYLVTASSASSTYKTYRPFILRPADELPILGSSRASQNFVPSLLSPKAFNYGVDGSGMGETLFFLEQCLRNGGTEPILINLDPWGFPTSTTYQADYRLALRVPAVREALPPARTALSERLPGIRFHGALRSNLTAYLNARFAVTKVIDAGATLQILSRTPEEWAAINQKRTEPTRFSCSPEWQARLDAIYRLTNRPIIWVVGPLAPHDRSLYQGQADLEAFLYRQLQHPHVYAINWLDFPEPMTEADFMDPTHLNQRGAERFTRLLRLHLEALKIGAHSNK